MTTEVEQNVIYLTDFEDAIVKLFKRGTIACFIEGRRNSGKTDISLLIMEIAFRLHLVQLFGTNIKGVTAPFEVKYMDNLEDVDYWARNDKGTKLYVLDEAGTAIRRRSPMNKLNVDILSDLQTLRHFDLNLFLLAPAEKYIDSAAMGTDVLDLIIVKPLYSNPKIALWLDQLTHKKMTFSEIPPTTLGFDKKSVAVFNRKSSGKRPQFSDSDTQLLWDWSHGSNSKALGVDKMKIHRLSVKFIKEVLEKESNK